MRHGVVCHGDCDGVISAFIYIKHYMMDYYPGHIDMVFTQPWRAHIDARKLSSELGEVVFLDLAISNELSDFILKLKKRAGRIVVVDHHMSSKEYVDMLSKNDVKVVWSKAPSTPHLIKDALNPFMNPYEDFLVEVADVCEGNETKNPEVANVADLIKLSIARDPGDLEYMRYLVNLMLNGKDLSNDQEVVRRAKVAKFLLRRLLKIMGERAIEISGAKVVALDLPESRIYAGLLGIAATEFSKMCRKDVILIRKEERKAVVTVRSVTDRAFRICKALAEALKGKFGGHAEAASTTLPNLPLNDAVRLVVEVIKNVPRKT